MNKEIRIVRCLDYEAIVEVAYVGYDEGDYDSFAFVGDLDAIQKILAVLLNDYDMEFTSAHIDTVEYDGMYQLIVDGYEMITIAPVLEHSNDDIRKGYVLIEGIGKWFVDDSASARFVRTLEKGGYNFEVFEVDDTTDDVAYADSFECNSCSEAGVETGICDKEQTSLSQKLRDEIANIKAELDCTTDLSKWLDNDTYRYIFDDDYREFVENHVKALSSLNDSAVNNFNIEITVNGDKINADEFKTELLKRLKEKY